MQINKYFLNYILIRFQLIFYVISPYKIPFQMIFNCPSNLEIIEKSVKEIKPLATIYVHELSLHEYPLTILKLEIPE